MASASRVKRGLLSYVYDDTTRTHTLTSNYPLYSPNREVVMYFTPTHDYSPKDKIKINGKAYSACGYDGADLEEGFFTAFATQSTYKNIIECKIVQNESMVYMNKLVIDELTELTVKGENHTVDIVNSEYRTLVSFDFIGAPSYGNNIAVAIINFSITNSDRYTSYLDYQLYVNDELQPFEPKSSFGKLDEIVPVNFLVPINVANVGLCNVTLKAKTPAAEVNVAVNTSNLTMALKGINLYNIV